MRTSLSEIQLIEQYLLNQLSTAERLVFEARLITEANLRANVAAQQQAMDILKFYQVKQIQEKLNNRFASIIKDPAKVSFRERVKQIFQLI